MGSFKENRTLSVIWDKLQSLLGYSGVSNPLLANTTIDEPLTLYVETTGNDLNPGTADKPFKTIQAAIDLVAGRPIKAAVTVLVGPGTFDGFSVNNIQIPDNTTGGVAGSFTIKGSVAASTLTTGTATGTATGGADTYLVDSTQNWTPGELKGKFLVMPLSFNGSRHVSIFDNTSDTIYFTNQSTGAGMTYTIQEPTTWISKTVATSTVANATCVSVGGGNDCRSSTQIVVQNLGFNVSSGSAITASALAGGSFLIDGCKIITSGSGVAVVSTGMGVLSISFCSIETSGTGTQISLGSGFSTRVAFNSYIRKTGAVGGTAVSLILNTYCSMTAAVIENFATGVRVGSGTSVSTGAGLAMTNSASCKNCTVGIDVSGKGAVAYFNSPQYIVHTNNTTWLSVSKGASATISSITPTGSSTEISVDGTTTTLAAMRALSPKAFPATPNAYGTVVYE
jgi:hypothetical protein